MTVRRAALTLVLAGTLGSAVSAAAASAKKHQQTAPSGTPAPAAAPDAKAVTVSLSSDGQTHDVQTAAATIADLFKEQNLSLTANDRCSFALSTQVKNGLQIVVTRVRTETVVERTSLPFAVRQKFTGSLPVGKKNVLQAGVKGEHIVKFFCYYKDNKLVEKQKVGGFNTPSRPQVEVVGTRGMTLASRGYFAGRRVIEMVATGYGPSGNGKWGAQTASGLRPGFGVVAVDPRFIPLGTRLYVDGYGYAVAGDTGGAIKGNRIDLGHDTESAASAVGRRRVRVLILD